MLYKILLLTLSISAGILLAGKEFEPPILAELLCELEATGGKLLPIFYVCNIKT